MHDRANAKAEEELYKLQADFCRGMAHPKRVCILSVLKNGEKTVRELVELTGIPQANLSQHLGILRQLGIVQARRTGVSMNYSIGDHRVVEACELVRRSIGERLRKSRMVLEVTV